MSIWMEVRCDLNLGQSCWDATNKMVEEGGWNRTTILARARKLGWRFTPSGGAHCPACQKEAAA